MLRKNIRFLYGGGICVLLVALVVIFNHYRNSPPQDPVKIYKTTVPTKRAPKQEKPEEVTEVSSQPESDRWDDANLETPQITETKASEGKFLPELEGLDDFLELLPTTQAEEPPQEDPRAIMLKKVFLKLGTLQREAQELLEDMKEPVDPANPDPRWHTLEAELQGHCRRVNEEFPGTVSFFTFQGEEWAYDIDFGMLQDSLGGPVSTELEEYFRYASLREMFGLPDISQEQLQQLQ